MRLVIGFAEYIDLPDLGVAGLRAKVDTGARTSALHVADIEQVSDDEVSFRIVKDSRKKKKAGAKKRRAAKGPVLTVPILRVAHVRSSTGHEEERFFIHTTLRLGPIEREIELSLASRGEMRYRMLLGRQALAGPFLIDVQKRYTVGGPDS